MDMILGEAFATMDMDVDRDQGTESDTKAWVDGRAEVEGQMDRADLVVIGANIGATEVDMAGATLEELLVTKQEFPFWNPELLHLW